MSTVDLKLVLSNPRLFIRWWLELHGIVLGAGKRIKCQSGHRNLSSLFSSAWLDYREQVAAFNSGVPKGAAGIKGFTRDDLEMALHEFIELKAIEALKAKREELKCIQSDLALLQIFLKACTGKCDSKEVAVIAHFLWLIKRKMFGLKVVDHIMPVFYGAQGSGKSTAVSILLEIIVEWRSDIKIDELTDSRNGHSLQENFVVVFDEMQNASKADIDVLKNRITADRFACRKLGTNIVDQLQQNCTFIGTTNRPLDEQIVDPTGMRRFYQFKTLDKMDWEIINSIDYLSLWCGIDENKEDGYLKPFAEEILKIQEPLCATDPINEFITDLKLNGFTSGEAEILTSTLYAAYRSWCQKNGYKPINSNWFNRKLGNRGIEGGKNSDGHRVRKVSNDAVKLIEAMAVDPWKGYAS